MTINLNPLLPVRKEPREQSEMCTQLLFGEQFTILETTEKWYRIRNQADQYEGWIDRKMASDNNDNLKEDNSETILQIFTPLAQCRIENLNETIYLPAGSRFRHYDIVTGYSSIGNNTYVMPTDTLMKLSKHPASGNLLLSIAKSFLNAPYLWGGKSIFGIDCSGLVQLCYALCGIQLPRDASQQVQNGYTINSLSDSTTADLAFFENESGKIVHVGILLDNQQIIHASGKVRIDLIDEQGIKLNNSYTHRLKIIKRVLS
jgi:hypothetical protein